jgi:hypothetical protein
VRRLRTVLLAAALLGATAARSQDAASPLLGAAGEVYTVQRGTYKALFPNPPAGWGSHVVLALDIAVDGKQQRVLVPGTDGAEEERSPALAIDRDSSRGYLVWSVDRAINLIGFSAAGWGEVHEVSGDPGTVKSNPQLATTVDRYQRLDADGELVWISRSILHLVWYDDGPAGQRVLYTPLVIEDGDVVRGNRVFDLQELAGGEPASGAASPLARGELLQRPQVIAGRDQRHVVVGFVAPASGELVTLELQSVLGEMAFFGDYARAVVIDIGRNHPNASPSAAADLARAVVIDIGRRLLRPAVADLLSNRFLGVLAAGEDGDDLATLADDARGELLAEGVGLRVAAASQSAGRHLEIGRDATPGSTSHLLEVRAAARRALPALPGGDVRLLLSSHGDEAALAWAAAGAVRYRESGGGGWSAVRSLALGPGMSAADAFRLVEQRLASR